MSSGRPFLSQPARGPSCQVWKSQELWISLLDPSIRFPTLLTRQSSGYCGISFECSRWKKHRTELNQPYTARTFLHPPSSASAVDLRCRVKGSLDPRGPFCRSVLLCRRFLLYRWGTVRGLRADAHWWLTFSSLQVVTPPARKVRLPATEIFLMDEQFLAWSFWSCLGPEPR